MKININKFFSSNTSSFLGRYLIVLLLISSSLFLGKKFGKHHSDLVYTIPFLQIDEKKVDSVFQKLSVDEKIGQLIILSIDSTISNEAAIQQFHKFKISGFLFDDQLTAKRINLMNLNKGQDAIPIYLGLNSLNGSCLWFDSANISITSSMLISNISDSIQTLYYQYLAKKCLEKNINLYFNPLSYSILHDEASDSENCTFLQNKIQGFATVFQVNRILFSSEIIEFRKTAPEVYKNLLSNYQKLETSGISSFFTNESSSNNKGLLTKEELITKLNFQGIVFSKLQENEYREAEKLINSPTDVIIVKKDVDKLVAYIKECLESGKIHESDIDNKVRKIIRSKLWIKEDLAKKKIVNENQINRDIKFKIVQNSICIIKNKDSLLPVKLINDSKFHVLTIGKENLNEFTKNIGNYVSFQESFFNPEKEKIPVATTNKYVATHLIVAININEIDSLKIKNIADYVFSLKSKKKIVILFGKSELVRYFVSFDQLVYSSGSSISEQKYSAQLLFGGIAATGIFPETQISQVKFGAGFKTKQTRLRYSTPEDAHVNSTKLLKIDSIVNHAIQYGAIPGCQVFVAKNGIVIYNKAFGNQAYDSKAKVSITDLYDVASITKIAATTLATMKMVSMGKMSINDELGKFFRNTHIEYTRIKPDTILHIDTLLIKDVKDMKKFLLTQDTVHLNDSVMVAYDTLIVAITPKNNIFKVTLRELLIHQSGVLPVMPILKYIQLANNESELTSTSENLSTNKFVKINTKKSVNQTSTFTKEKFEKYFSKKQIKDSAEIQIAENMYFRKKYFDTLWMDTKQLPVYSRKVFQYSDVNMILLQQAIDSTNHITIEQFLSKNFFMPLGLTNICFNPLGKVNKQRIIPTENDKIWRNQTLLGFVHDPSAAMLGGMSGNAGLFSSAQNLGVVFQMILNGGNYGGFQYLRKDVVNQFCHQQPETHRGLGFDMPFKNTIIAKDAPSESFGHTGFTGCCVWVDPKNELVFVFLSNRVNPSAKNWKLNGLKLRERVHQAVYDAFEK